MSLRCEGVGRGTLSQSHSLLPLTDLRACLHLSRSPPLRFVGRRFRLQFALLDLHLGRSLLLHSDQLRLQFRMLQAGIHLGVLDTGLALSLHELDGALRVGHYLLHLLGDLCAGRDVLHLGRHTLVVALLPQLLKCFFIVQLGPVALLLHLALDRLRLVERLVLEVLSHLLGNLHISHGDVVNHNAILLEILVHRCNLLRHVGVTQIEDVLHVGVANDIT
mmetsp:Transcript_16059/g.34722  ORF Transcript_16059/g.34722 Transcript_16059/m.34722 type:complete len:220 (-) Transcript_16059:661-1320(-)